MRRPSPPPSRRPLPRIRVRRRFGPKTTRSAPQGRGAPTPRETIDRKKELIINAAGKNMSPANIEAKIKASSPLIGQVCAVGDNRPYNVALIVLDPDFAPVFAQQQGIEGKSLEELAAEPAIRAEIEAAVERGNAGLARVEQVKRFALLPGEWAPGADELTPTMELKRRPIERKYEAEIEGLYAG